MMNQTSEGPTVVTSPEQQSISFKDKLLDKDKKYEEATIPSREELLLEPKDVSIAIKGQVPFVNFSPRVHKIIAGHTQYAVVVKLLRRFVRRDIVHKKITSH